MRWLPVLLVVLVGCGGSDEQTPESVAKGFVAAAVNNDGERACGYLNKAAKEGLTIEGVDSCAEILPDLKADFGTKVESVNVSGNRATATTNTTSFKLQKQGDGWLISEF